VIAIFKVLFMLSYKSEQPRKNWNFDHDIAIVLHIHR